MLVTVLPTQTPQAFHGETERNLNLELDHDTNNLWPSHKSNKNEVCRKRQGIYISIITSSYLADAYIPSEIMWKLN